MRTLLADFRYAFRVLGRAPSFAATVVAVLALGIGANTAIFSIVNAVLLRPLPFEEPDRLVRLLHVPPQNAFPGMPTFPVSPANFYDWKRDARLFEGMAIYRFRQFTLTGGGNAEAVVAGAVGADFFQLVRVQPSFGRVFLAEEDFPGRSHVVVISDGFWKSHLGGGSDALGRTLSLDGEAYTIVGIMPARFSVASWGATARDLWVPLAYTDAAARRSRKPQRPGGRATEARRGRGAGESRDGRHLDAARAGVPAGQRGLGRDRHPAAGADRRRRPDVARDAAGRRRAGPADRVRERRQPALRARARPPQGDRDPRRPWAPDAPVCSSNC